MRRFEICLERVLRHEGGYVDDPQDPGGATNLGVTLATARAFRLDVDGDGDVDKVDVRGLTPADAAPVYYHGYWMASGADLCPPGLDYLVFDCAVNQGVRRAVRWLQTVVGVPADGMVGPTSRSAILAVPARSALRSYAALREAHYRSLPGFPRFGRGWMRRLNEATELAMKDAL